MWMRSRAPVLASTAATCVLTVVSARNRSAAISLLLRPRATPGGGGCEEGASGVQGADGLDEQLGGGVLDQSVAVEGGEHEDAHAGQLRS